MSKFVHTLIRYISVIQRNYMRYMDAELRDTGIGFGQCSFLTCIHEYDAITMYDLAQIGGFDKGTVTRAIQKLEDLGYVTVHCDEKDRRLKHLHVTEQAAPVLERIQQARLKWKDILLAGMSQEEQTALCRQLEQLAIRSFEGSGPHNSCCFCPSGTDNPRSDTKNT